ncbi:hypothetical protein CEP52_005409 [Fusarium oligoseptatum]|uniref:Uncharacterized protein n=1 Tax=Fusarium oligoseptatum TaxID=2604345 RepID=A0A428TYD0_9HYPO|nr:hypothetical protein CEP52_005409 [Fusarium oligoseptatum]
MSLTPLSLQWSLDNSAHSVISVAKGALQAATSDNVQVLAILSCERFGNTVAMSTETRRRMERSVVPTPPPAVLGFLQVTVGYAASDCVTYLGRSMAGLQFLGLACALVTTMDAFQSGLAVHAMVEDSAADKTLVPTEKQIIDLLKSITPRCSRSGFANEVAGWQLLLRNSTHPGLPPYRSMFCPHIEAVMALVDAFRQLRRVGGADVAQVIIEVSDWAPWTAAFTKWCLGFPPSIIDKDGVPILEQAGSEVLMIIRPELPRNFKVTVHSSIGAPSELVSAKFDPQVGLGMVRIGTYGQLLMSYYEFDRGTAVRAVQQALPYALRQTHQKMVFWGRGAGNASPLEWWKPLQGENEGLVLPVNTDLKRLKASPFPPERVIAKLYAAFLGLPELPEFRNLDPGLVISDLPLVRLHMQHLAGVCRCSECSAPRLGSPRCIKNLFLEDLAILVADILALSLFQNPDSLLVYYTSTSRWGENSQFIKDVRSVITKGHGTVCPLGCVLERALELIGHETKYSRGWVMSSYNGQAVWPTIYETSNYEKEGFLSLSWLPGHIWHKNTSHKVATSTDAVFATTDSEMDIRREGVSEPCDLYPTLQVQWQATLRADGLQVSIGLKGKAGTLKVSHNPAYILENLANALLVGKCQHSPDAKLDAPDRFSFLTGPIFPFDPLATDGMIGIVAVDRRDELGLMALSCDFPPGQFVILRKGACLSCCLQVARDAGAGAIVL